jgi:hypothetical protein
MIVTDIAWCFDRVSIAFLAALALGLSSTSWIVISGCLSFKIACDSWYLVLGALVELIIAMNQ